MLWKNLEYPVVSGGGNPEYPAKTNTKPQVTGNILTCPGQDSKAGYRKRQQAVSSNALDHLTIMATL